MARPLGSKNKPKEDKPVTEAPVETKEAVADEPEKPTAEPAFKSRTNLLNEINSINKERAAEAEEAGEDIEQIDTAAIEKEEKEDSIVEPPKEEKKEPEAVKRKFIVDGKDVELTEEQIIERVQKSAAVDARLAEANKILEDAKRQAATRENPKPANPPSAQSSSQADVDDIQKDASDLAKVLIYGDEEKVSQAVAKILGNGRQQATQPQVDPRSIQTYVSETLAFERGKQLLETPPDQGGFADVWNDPVMKARFQQRENELRDSGDSRPYADLYKSIGTEIRQWRDELVKKFTPPTGLENRDELKRKTGVVRGAGGKLPAPMEAKPKTHDEILNSLRRGRGLN